MLPSPFFSKAWLNEEGWDNVTELDKVGGFHGVIDSFEQYSRDWNLWYTHPEPESLPLIGKNVLLMQMFSPNIAFLL